MKKLFSFTTALCISVLLLAQDNSVYQKQAFVQNADTLQYRIMYPMNYKEDKKYPMLVFLHGSGERGNDNELQLVHGGKLFADPRYREQFPAIIIFPQCAANDSWTQLRRVKSKTDSTKWVLEFPADVPMTRSLSLVSSLLDSMAEFGSVDKKRVYVGGLSMGGFGTFEILGRKPGFFAAAFPICGGGNESKVILYGKKFPIWVFHGGADPVVDVSNSRRMVAALKTAGAKVKYSEYAGVGHNSWDNAFEEPELLPWLFAQKK